MCHVLQIAWANEIATEQNFFLSLLILMNNARMMDMVVIEDKSCICYQLFRDGGYSGRSLSEPCRWVR